MRIEVMHQKLRKKLKELEIDQVYLAEKLDLARETVSRRMTGKLAWTSTEMYIIMNLIREPHEKLHEYFPESGKAAA